MAADEAVLLGLSARVKKQQNINILSKCNKSVGLLGLQEPKVGFKLYLLSNAEKKWLKALHLPEQVATRATVSSPDVVRLVGKSARTPSAKKKWAPPLCRRGGCT